MEPPLISRRKGEGERWNLEEARAISDHIFHVIFILCILLAIPHCQGLSRLFILS